MRLTGDVDLPLADHGGDLAALERLLSQFLDAAPQRPGIGPPPGCPGIVRS